jgi:acetylornithine/succinyldiaminopimelate/putrescine aminotransferase
MPTQRELFLRHLAQTSPIPLGLEITHAEGCRLYGKDGKQWLDMISGISVSALGHSHPAVKEAVHAQVDKHMHLMVYGEYVQSPQVDYAKALTDTLPPTLNTVYFTNSGTEATEGAMKLAKRVTGRTQFISCYNAYHGSTQGALSIAGGDWLSQAFRPLLPNTQFIQFNAVEDLALITEETAAVFIEPVQGEAGAVVAAEGYLKAVRRRCNETGTLLVFDEIQTGMGRTGTLWAFEQSGVTPDILLLGKSLGGGMPLGAFISSHENMQLFTHDPVLGHITTFGGHPVSCAAGLAAFTFIRENDLAKAALEKEALLRELLPGSTLHGKGLLLALDLGDFDRVQKVIHYCLKNGLITDWFLFNDHCIRIAPPLLISDEEIHEACDVLRKAMEP